MRALMAERGVCRCVSSTELVTHEPGSLLIAGGCAVLLLCDVHHQPLVVTPSECWTVLECASKCILCIACVSPGCGWIPGHKHF
jgi:hypothetical protein